CAATARSRTAVTERVRVPARVLGNSVVWGTQLRISRPPRKGVARIAGRGTTLPCGSPKGIWPGIGGVLLLSNRGANRYETHSTPGQVFSATCPVTTSTGTAPELPGKRPAGSLSHGPAQPITRCEPPAP